MKLKLLFLLSFLISIPVMAQQTKTVSGTIKDANEIPLPGAEVKVIGKEIFDVTNFDGEFSLSNVSEGDIFRVTFLFIMCFNLNWFENLSLSLLNSP